MSTLEPRDLRIQRFSEATDWAGLLRFSMSLGCNRREVQEAIACVERVSFDELGQQYWLLEQLREFSEHGTDPMFQIDEPVGSAWTQAEEITLQVVRLYPVANLCEKASWLVASEREKGYEIGREFAQEGISLADSIRDDALSGYFYGLVANSYVRQRLLKQSLHCFQYALFHHTEAAKGDPEVYISVLARTQGNLASVYGQIGDFSAAVKMSEESLKTLERERDDQSRNFLAERLSILINLGVAFLSSGELQESRVRFESSIELLSLIRETDQESCLEEEGTLFLNFGVLLHRQAEFEKAEKSYEAAMDAYQLASHYSRRDLRIDIANTWQNQIVMKILLGRFEEALEVVKTADGIFNQLMSESPVLYATDAATYLVNAGTVYRRLGQMDRAVESYKTAAELFRIAIGSGHFVQREHLIEVTLLLGICSRLNGDIDSSIDHFLFALGLCDHAETDPARFRDVGEIMLRLGHALAEKNNTEDARRAFLEARKMFQQFETIAPEQSRDGIIDACAGLAFSLKADRRFDEAIEEFQKAADLLEQVGETLNASVHRERGRIYYSLGSLLQDKYEREHETGVLHSSLKWLRLARDAQEFCRYVVQGTNMRNDSFAVLKLTNDRLIEVLSKVYLVDRNERYLCEMFLVAENNHLRILREMLEEDDFAPDDAPADLVERFRNVRQSTRHLDLQIHLLERDSPIQDAMPRVRGEFAGKLDGNADLVVSEQCRSALQERVRQLKSQLEMAEAEFAKLQDEVYSYGSDASNFTSDSISAEEIQNALPDASTAAVQFMLTEKSGHIVLLTKEKVALVELPDCSSQEVFSIAGDLLGDVGSEKLGDGVERNRRIEQAIARIGRIAIQPLATAIPSGIQRLILAPHQGMHVMPLHACLVAEGRLLCDYFEVQFVPSFSIWCKCLRRERSSTGEVLLLDANSDDLNYREPEIKSICKRFPAAVTVMSAENASKDEVFSSLRNAAVLHYIGHAEFDFENPLEAVLKYGDETKRLSLREVFVRANPAKARLVVLSACETGLFRPDLLDEYISFPTAFLFAGARCVVSSLWRVPDLPTMLLMDRFYGNVQDGLNESLALHFAQKWLRGVADHRVESLDTGAEVSTYVRESGILECIDDPMLREICEFEMSDIAEDYPDMPPFAAPLNWAGFVMSGVSL